VEPPNDFHIITRRAVVQPSETCRMRVCAAWAYLKSSAQQIMGSLDVKESLLVDRKC
jgi:hypothetical protein